MSHFVFLWVLGKFIVVCRQRVFITIHFSEGFLTVAHELVTEREAASALQIADLESRLSMLTLEYQV